MANPARGAVVHLARGAPVDLARGWVVHLAQGAVIDLARGAVLHLARDRGTAPLGTEVLPRSGGRYPLTRAGHTHRHEWQIPARSGGTYTPSRVKYAHLLNTGGKNATAVGIV